VIDRQHGRLFMACDNCGEVREDVAATEFRAMIDGAKADGWKIRNPRPGLFQHLCPDCQPALRYRQS
jgi:hypothetical protein